MVRPHSPGSQRDGFPRKQSEDTSAEERFILGTGNRWDLALLREAGLEEEKHAAD